MKKFLVVLTLLSAYVQSYGYDICNDPEVKASIEENNSKLPVKMSNDLMFVNVVCVNNNVELTLVASDKFFKIFEKSDKTNSRRAMCLNPNAKVWLSTVGLDKLIETVLNESFTKKYQVSVTEKECKELLPGF
ncbi:hypothetical protein KDD93_01205 [Campylobacter sp. faydin G-24]|uniref:Uncharacterized protein n=1 Tax=Campylobacter anatolicus TaxID=2829105 RepID=A0ABS5HI46_9BACT|nr:hypothetical protein [Campylobacter anatolicus]MBR8463192.1 hypothetical protein [Campylobacter anatolicus]